MIDWPICWKVVTTALVLVRAKYLVLSLAQSSKGIGIALAADIQEDRIDGDAVGLGRGADRIHAVIDQVRIGRTGRGAIAPPAVLGVQTVG
ncbi:MAG: hypothetical protein V4601_03645, partial [Pseudomonadota bacterium]